MITKTQDKTARYRLILSIFGPAALIIGLISWASGVGLQAEQNRQNIENLSQSLEIECDQRALKYEELDKKIQQNADINKKEFTEIKVRLAQIDTKQDTSLEYMLKIIEKED